MSAQQTHGVTGLVLAGGAGRRMGSVDKGWLEVLGRSLIRRVLARLQPQVDSVLINANRHRSRYAGLGHPVVGDRRPGLAGPMAGMEVGLASCRTVWLLCVPVDAAHLPADLASRLLRSARHEATPIAVVSDGEQLNPVCCMLASHLGASLSAALDAGERSPYRWLMQHAPAIVPFDDWPRGYWSTNTPAQLQALRDTLSDRGCEPRGST